MDKAAAFGDRVAVVDGETGERSYTFAQVDEMARSVAASLVARGLEAGDRVLVMLPNMPEFAVAMFGALLANAQVVTLSVTVTAEQLGHALRDLELRHVVTLAAFEERVRECARAQGADCAPKEVFILGPLAPGISFTTTA